MITIHFNKTRSTASASRLTSEQVRLLNNTAPSKFAGSLLIAASTCFLLWDHVTASRVLMWAALLLIVKLASLSLFIVLRLIPDALPSSRWLLLLRGNFLLEGIAWGALPVFMFPGELPYQVFLPFIAAGITGAALASLTPDRISILLFSVTALLPLIVRLFIEGGEIRTTMASLIFLYFLFLAAAARRGEKTFREMLKLREQTTRQNDALNQAQEIAQLGSFEWNPMTGELQWSDQHFRLWGLSPGAVVPDYALFRQGVHPDDITHLEEVLQQALQGGRQYDCIHRVIWPDGSEHYIHGRGDIIFNQDNQPIQMIGTMHDITERILAENKIKSSEQSLKQLVSELNERIKESHCLNNVTQTLLDESLADEAVLAKVVQLLPSGYNIPEETGARIRFGKMTCTTPDFKETAWQECATIPMQKKGIFTVEIFCRNGPKINVDDSPFTPEKKALLNNIATQIAQAMGRRLDQKALRQARDEAQRANMAKSEFLSSMSHELRTPMNAILGFGQLLELDDTLNSENQDYVREIVNAGNHLLGLINEVLDLAKIESGHIEMSLEAVDVSSVINECLSLVSTLASKRDIRIKTENPTSAVVHADYMRLKQALLNLLSNAIKYNRKGGSVMLEVSSEDASSLNIKISDTGHGIPEERLHELFMPFNRLGAENSEVEGTGIGLTITRRIIELMGGTVNVTSETGVGSTFWITLPLAELPEATPASTLLPSEKAVTVATQPHDDTQHLVLYVEDNPANLKLVTMILNRRKHLHLLTAHTPELGLELAIAHRPELILLDINMPGMDGYQVLKALKANSLTKTIPVIAVTANAMPRDIEQGQKAGFDHYLTKPINVVRLNALIDEYLQLASGN